MNLHRRGRQQHQPLGALLQRAHQPQQGVGPLVLPGAGRTAAGVMGFVQHDQIPRFGFFEQNGGPLPPPHELAGRNHRRLHVPRLALRIRLANRLCFTDGLPRRGGLPNQLPPVVDGPVQVELLAQFDLPLLEHRLGRQDQDALGLAGQPSLPQQQPGLYGLAKAHFVRNQQFRRPIGVQTLEGAGLMRPRPHCRGRLAHLRTAIRQPRGLGDEVPHQAAQIDQRFRRCNWRNRWRRAWGRAGGGLQALGQILGIGHEAHQVLPNGIRHIQHDQLLEAVGP